MSATFEIIRITCEKFQDVALSLFKKYVSIMDFVLEVVEMKSKKGQMDPNYTKELEGKMIIYRGLIDNISERVYEYVDTVAKFHLQRDDECKAHKTHVPPLHYVLIVTIMAIDMHLS
uniref:AlNc14C141G7255 protein n=1 Tax=Albugo laibachii Nc14 TaxID=890382 RepID=F0WL67_9STRA|nr:AlNc14C141G7255 [Albugo laibachii Nc14]|eukprot:CCA22028.1 AlNc14C141G7255 [Albugo laibachii Nc14]